MPEEVKHNVIRALMERDTETKIKILEVLLTELQTQLDAVNHELCQQRNSGDERYFRGKKEALESFRRTIQFKLNAEVKLRDENK